MARLIKCFDKYSPTKSVQETQQRIYEDVAQHTKSNSQQDDITLLGFELS